MKHGNMLNIALIALFFILLPFGGQALNLYIDWLWFGEVGQREAFLTILGSKLKVGFVIGLASFLVIYLNLLVALRFKSSASQPISLNLAGIPQLQQILSRLGLVGAGLALFLSFSYGLWAASNWQNTLFFFNGSSFGQTDPLFNKDLSFFVFRLPFLLDMQSWLFTTAGLATALLIPVYFLRGGVVVAPGGFFMDRAPKVHISVMAGLLLLLKACDYFLQQYQLVLSQRGVVFGATYADIHAKLPALQVMGVIAAIAGVFIIAAALRQGWKAQAGAVILVVAGHILGLSVFPELLHKFRVVPNEIAAERPYIQHNINSTRYAYGLDKIEVRDFPAEENLTRAEVNRNSLTVKNIRLWDHRPLLTTFKQLQQIRTYYDFTDVDNDRYMIDGEYRQLMLSPREMSYAGLKGTNWINEHLTYTHGYGVAVGPVNRISKEGLPEFFVKDIPPSSTVESLKVTRPEIYYGENPNEYVFVKTKAQEFDYPSGDKNVYTTYSGTGGIPMGSIFNKLAFAARFGTMKVLLSQDITAESRIMIYRDILDRAARVAPYLRFDQDPYMVISEGRLFWLVDGYTATNMIPYSQPIRGLGNYIRNSVKVVIDAYNGSMEFYINDPSDPLIRAYAALFPKLYKPLAQMPADIRSHLRYPQDLFAMQARMYAVYHMTDPQIFYNKEDLWAVPRRNAGQGEADLEPYYTVMKLPGLKGAAANGVKEEFLLTLPFTPSKRDNMAALIAARSDGEDYGKIVVYTMPKQKLVYGPRQIDARIDQNAEISEQLTLWGQRGSTVIRGSLLAIPIEDSLLYVEPLYLAAEAGSLPELRRVVVSYGNRMVMEETLEKALEVMFGGGAGARAEETPRAAAASVDAGRSVSDLARMAQDHYSRAIEAQRQGNWSRYGDELKQLELVLKQMTTKR